MKVSHCQCGLLLSLLLASSGCIQPGEEDLGGEADLGEAQQPLTNLAAASFDLPLTRFMDRADGIPAGTFNTTWEVRNAGMFPFYNLSVFSSQPRYYCISTSCNARAARFNAGQLQQDPGTTIPSFLVDFVLVDRSGATCGTGTTLHALIGVSDTPFGNCPF